MRHAVAASLVAVSMMACAGDTRTASERAVRAVWHEYLTSKQGQFAAQAGTPSPLWNAAEQARWPMYDLAGFYLPDHAVPEVVSITRVNAAVDTAYQIVTRFWPPSATPRDSSSKPVLTMTVYARRDRTRWELVNALSFKTSRWVRESRGRIAYRVAPSLRFDESTALRAATFVDSLAAAFELPPPDTIESSSKRVWTTGAVLAEMVHESGGVGAVSEYLRTPGSPHAMRAGLERILHRPWPTIVTEWRRYVSRIAAH